MLPERVIDIQSCHDLLQCAFTLSDFEIEIYQKLEETGPVRTDELATVMGKDRSTVYRSLQKLMSCGMVHRETKNLKKGGYYHSYSAVKREVLKSRLEQCINDWYQRMRMELERFESEM